MTVGAMESDFYRHIDTRRIYQRHRRFLAWFLPLMMGVFVAIAVAYRDEHPDILPGVVFCGGGGALLIWWLVSRVVKDSAAGQVYEIRNGRVRYASPSFLLGKSFDLAFEDIVEAVETDEGEGFEFEIRTKDGEATRCHGEEPETKEFFNELVRQIWERDTSAST